MLRKLGIEPAAVNPKGELPLSRRRARSPDGLNKTERDFAWTLASGSATAIFTQAIKLRLAGKTWYTPDFLVYADDEQWFIEIKGHMRDDAAVKLKVAATKYPEWRWLLIRREGRQGWDVREVTRNGIGTAPMHVGWIHGIS